MNKLKWVALVTENCEVFAFDAKFAKSVRYTNNETEYATIHQYDNGRMEVLVIELEPNTELLSSESFISLTSLTTWDTRTDIVAVELVFDDGTVKSKSLEWPDGEENRYLQSHPGQRWEETPNGSRVFSHRYVVE